MYTLSLLRRYWRAQVHDVGQLLLQSPFVALNRDVILASTSITLQETL